MPIPINHPQQQFPECGARTVGKSENTTTVWELPSQSTVSAAETEDDMFTPTADIAASSDITRILTVMCTLRNLHLTFGTTPANRHSIAFGNNASDVGSPPSYSPPSSDDDNDYATDMSDSPSRSPSPDSTSSDQECGFCNLEFQQFRVQCPQCVLPEQRELYACKREEAHSMLCPRLRV